MGTGRVVHPTQRCPPPDISQNWGSKKGERTESPTRYTLCARGRAPTVQDLGMEDVRVEEEADVQRRLQKMRAAELHTEKMKVGLCCVEVLPACVRYSAVHMMLADTGCSHCFSGKHRFTD